MEETETQKKRRTLRLVAGLALAGLCALALLFYWMYPAHQTSRGFETPKITVAHVDEEPFMRVELKEGESYRPIELMAGTEVEAICEVVSRASRRAFALTAFGTRQTAADCQFRVQVPDEVGRFGVFSFEFRDGDAATPTDVMDVPVVVVATGERMEFLPLEDEKGQTLDGVSVPEKVRVYVKAALDTLPQPAKDYCALFFVADPLNGIPVLQLAPTEEGETPRPLVGNVVRYRSFGKSMAGYALWTPEPITLPGEARRVYDIYAGIFLRASVDSVFARTLSVEKTGPDSIRVKPLIASVDEVRPMTVLGRTLTAPLHVIRGPGAVEAGGATR